MTDAHIDNTVLLLYAYGETPSSEHGRIENHLGHCLACREQLRHIELEREAAALALTESNRRRVMPKVAMGLAAAAVLVVLLRGKDDRASQTERSLPWNSRTLSTTAGYVTGAGALTEVDSVLTGLERELSHAR